MRQLEQELEGTRSLLYSATYLDPETSLQNRNGLVDAIVQARRWEERRGDRFALLAARFDAGPDVPHCAAVFASALRAVDAVGRVGERTLVAVLNGTAPESVSEVVDRLADIMSGAGIECALTGGAVTSDQDPAALIDAILGTLAGTQPGPAVVSAF